MVIRIKMKNAWDPVNSPDRPSVLEAEGRFSYFGFRKIQQNISFDQKRCHMNREQKKRAAPIHWYGPKSYLPFDCHLGFRQHDLVDQGIRNENFIPQCKIVPFGNVVGYFCTITLLCVS